MLAMDIHPDTRVLADFLSATPQGQTVSLAALSATIGRNITQCRHLLYSAMKLAQSETGATFAGERGKGYRRLNTIELASIGQTARARIRRNARRGARSIAAGMAGANDIPPDVHRKILAEQSALGLLEHIARDKSVPVISEADVRALPVAQSAKQFLQSIGAA